MITTAPSGREKKKKKKKKKEGEGGGVVARGLPPPGYLRATLRVYVKRAMATMVIFGPWFGWACLPLPR